MTITTSKRPRAEPNNLFTGQSTSGPGVAEQHADDFVCDVLAIVAAMLPGLTPEQVQEADAAVRDRWGGDRPYIAKRIGLVRSDRNAAIRRDYIKGESFDLLERRYGLCKRRLIQLVKAGD